MSDIHPDALSLEDASIESPPIQQEPDVTVAEPDDSEHEGAVDVQGRRMVDVSVLSAERKRIREATEKAVREALAREHEPVKQKADEADRLRQALNEAQPYVEHLRQHPELLQAPKPTSLEDQVSDEEAIAEARDLELYNQQTGQPDVARAKRIIARRRQEAQVAAQQAAQAAVGPITSQTAQQTSERNYALMASVPDEDLRIVPDANRLKARWDSVPNELTQHPDVAKLVRDLAVLDTFRDMMRNRVQAPPRAPIVSEPAGGRSGPQYEMDRMAKNLANHAGMSNKAFSDSAKKYVPGEVNILGD